MPFLRKFSKKIRSLLSKKNSMKKLFFTFLTVFASHFLIAQSNFGVNIPFFETNADRSVRGQILVQLTEKTSVESVLENFQKTFPQIQNAREIFVFTEISPDFHIYRVDFSENFVKKEAVLLAAFQTSGVITAQFNYELDDRKKEPNDPQYFKQTSMDLIRADLAWDGATGGITPQGDTIVVAILEKGCFRNHPDLRENMWKNTREIPKNGIDDDKNGYIDDFEGWDVRNNTDGEGTVGPHGVSVAGIIGARANNTEGVSGVNWDVKMMSLVNVSFTSEIVTAYTYAFKQRRIYNMTGGNKGAFVVATNASFGLAAMFPANQPLWCAMYDSLGKVGVLNIGATDNANINVDIAGDLPSTCPSEYLIVVTNVGNNDVKENGAAYGAINVDLGAPGEAVWTTDLRINGADTLFYGAFPGTSASTPHVTGTVGWMYSLPCASLSSDAKTDPSTCAKRMRDLILNSIDPNPSLKNITTTGGRLDMFNILTASRELCGGTVGKLEILGITPPISSGEKLKVAYQTPDFIPYIVRVVDVLGRIMYEKRIKPDQFSEKTFEIETDYMANGTYFVVIQNTNGVAARRFMKIQH
jgi:serine protease